MFPKAMPTPSGVLKRCEVVMYISLQNVASLGSHIFMCLQRILMKLCLSTTFGLIRRAVWLILYGMKEIETHYIVEVVLIKNTEWELK